MIKWLIHLLILTGITTPVFCYGNAPAHTNDALPALNWIPPADSFDWIQLKSGEWLKGKIRVMQEGDLEFESEELDTLTLDWMEIRQLRSARSFDVLLGSNIRERQKGFLLEGRITATPTELHVDGENSVIVPRSKVQSFTRGGSRLNYWSGKGSFGLTVRGGNTEQTDYNASANFQRRTPDTRFSLDYLGTLSSVNKEKNTENHRINSAFDVWLSRRLYLMVPFAEYYSDKFQNLDYRLTLGVGMGCYLIDRRNIEWNITAGPAYQYTLFDSVALGESDTQNTEALVVSTHFEWDLTRRIEVLFDYSGQYTRPADGETSHHSVSTLSVELTTRFDLDLSFVWDRVEQPEPDSAGNRPEKDDYRMIAALAFDF